VVPTPDVALQLATVKHEPMPVGFEAGAPGDAKLTKLPHEAAKSPLAAG